MNATLDIMARTPLFGGLLEKDLEKIRRIAVKKRYAHGQTIFFEGDPGNGFYVVAQGKIKIYKSSPEGKELILHIYGPGNPFGEVPVFSNQRFPANAVALRKSTLLFFPRNGFVNLLTDYPTLAMNMLGILSARLREFTIQLENLSLKEVPGRLATYLIYLAREQRDKDNDIALNVSLDISKGQLASLLGTIPETLSRIFAKMTAAGLIRVKGPKIHLLNWEGLVILAEDGRIQSTR